MLSCGAEKTTTAMPFSPASPLRSAAPAAWPLRGVAGGGGGGVGGGEGQRVAADILEREGLGRDADEVIERGRAEARHRGAEVLELVRCGRAVEAFDDRHGPVV